MRVCVVVIILFVQFFHESFAPIDCSTIHCGLCRNRLISNLCRNCRQTCRGGKSTSRNRESSTGRNRDDLGGTPSPPITRRPTRKRTRTIIISLDTTTEMYDYEWRDNNFNSQEKQTTTQKPSRAGSGGPRTLREKTKNKNRKKGGKDKSEPEVNEPDEPITPKPKPTSRPKPKTTPKPKPKPKATPKTTPKPTTKKPKVKKNPNKVFNTCCKKNGKINSKCYNMCNYDNLNKQVLITAFLTKSCPPESWGPVLDCASHDKDHRTCCKAEGLGTFNGGNCLPFCYPKGGGLSLNPALLPCLDQLPKVVSCFKKAV